MYDFLNIDRNNEAFSLFGNVSKNSERMINVSSGNTSNSRMSCVPTAPVAGVNAYLRRILTVIGRMAECR